MARRVRKEADKIQDLEHQLKRALADYANLQRRVEEDKNQIINFAKSILITKFLQALDTLEAAANLADRQDSGTNKQGLELAVNQFQKVLREEGVEEIKTDGRFDPFIHEAVEVTVGKTDNKITQVLHKGYKIGNKVLRPAKVKVEKKSTS
ncbi:MAG TPA: nucleotide exchange factor GrpE [Candidatus Nanoarchaeia archaeon]